MKELTKRSRLESAAALAFYTGLAVVLFGRGILAAPAHEVVGDRGADKTIFMWSFSWWPHALAHLHDPFDANVVWAPAGIDLSWTTTAPGAALVMAPLTAAAGPVVSYNAVILAAPALAAWTAFLLAKRLTRAFWPSLIGGYVFGFSSYEIGHTVAHPNLTLVFLVPVVVLLACARFDGAMSSRRFVALLACVLAGQFLFSTEIFATMTLLAALVFGLALWILREERDRVRNLLRESVIALIAGLALVAPYLIHALVLSGPPSQPINAPVRFSSDVLAYVVPTHLTWLAPPGSKEIVRRFVSRGTEAYVGLPLVAVVALFARERWRIPAARLLLAAFAVLVVASFGPRIRVAGQTVGIGPWTVPARVPVLENALPVRLMMFVALAVGLICALWLAPPRGSRWRAWLLALIGVAAIVPNPSRDLWTSEVPRPALFTSDRWKRELSASDTALVLPYGPTGWSMLWQAESDFDFRMVGGHLGPPRVTRREERWRPVYRMLLHGEALSDPTTFSRFLQAHAVDAVVVTPGTRPFLRRLISTMGVVPVRVGDTLVYPVSQAVGQARVDILAPVAAKSRP